MKIRDLDPRYWSSRVANIVRISLFTLMMSSVMAGFALHRVGSHLSGVPVSHIVGREGRRYYQKPTGPFDLRETITKEQAENHERYERYGNWAGGASTVFLFACILAMVRRGGTDSCPNE